MKKSLLLIVSLLMFLGTFAQEFPFDDLPEIVRQDMMIEEEDFQDLQLPDSAVVNSEVGYYKGSARSESTDTIIYYKWHRIDQVWIPVHRLVKTYDAGENVISSLLQHRRPDGEWVNGVLKDYTYENGSLAMVLVQFYHPPTQAWYQHFRKLYSYYGEGSLAEIIHQVWFRPDQEWANRFRRVFVYGEDGLLTSDTTYNSRPVQQVWLYKHLNEYTYNDSGYRIMKMTSYYNADLAEWVNIHRELINPDEAGLVQDVTVQHRCWHMQSWKNMKRIEFSYNDADLATERLVKFWNHHDSLWMVAHRNLFTYDANENLDTLIFQKWRDGPEIWVNKELNDFEYDATGTLLSRLTQVWNPEEQAWRNFRLMQLIIDLKHLAAGISDPGSETESEITLNYPNPYNSSYSVNISGIDGKEYTVKVSDLGGRVVYNNRVQSGSAFRIDTGLTPGLYILAVSDDSRLIKTEKILISR